MLFNGGSPFNEENYYSPMANSPLINAQNSGTPIVFVGQPLATEDDDTLTTENGQLITTEG